MPPPPPLQPPPAPPPRWAKADDVESAASSATTAAATRGRTIQGRRTWTRIRASMIVFPVRRMVILDVTAVPEKGNEFPRGISTGVENYFWFFQKCCRTSEEFSELAPRERVGKRPHSLNFPAAFAPAVGLSLRSTCKPAQRAVHESRSTIGNRQVVDEPQQVRGHRRRRGIPVDRIGPHRIQDDGLQRTRDQR